MPQPTATETRGHQNPTTRTRPRLRARGQPKRNATEHAPSVQRNDANRVVACGTYAASKENGVHTASTVCARQGRYP